MGGHDVFNHGTKRLFFLMQATRGVCDLLMCCQHAALSRKAELIDAGERSGMDRKDERHPRHQL